MEAKRNSSKLALHLDSAIAPVCLTQHEATQSRKTQATKVSTRKEANTDCKTYTCMYVCMCVLCVYMTKSHAYIYHKDEIHRKDEILIRIDLRINFSVYVVTQKLAISIPCMILSSPSTLPSPLSFFLLGMVHGWYKVPPSLVFSFTIYFVVATFQLCEVFSLSMDSIFVKCYRQRQNKGNPRCNP